MKFLVFCVLFVQSFVAIKSDRSSEFAYYKNLWQENVRLAEQWRPTNRNTKFENIPQSGCKPVEKAYDFVIVGGGTAGSVMANRLSENPRWNVLVIEAGGPETNFTLIPGAYLFAMRSDKNWGYVTEPQKNACQQFPGGRCNMGRGRILGGETAMKDVTYARGNLKDFDSWGRFWSHRALRYFKVLENATALGDNSGEFEKYRGSHGHFHIRNASLQLLMADQLYAGFKELRYNWNRDYNAETQYGVSRMQSYTLNNGGRGSTAQRYLKPALNRPNLHVITDALATKIHFVVEHSPHHHHTGHKRAGRLEFLHGNSCHIVNITRELILTSGPINTPQLLMLSGVGAKEALKQHNITQVHNLPAVGQNLEDHVSLFDITIRVNKTFVYPKFDDELLTYLKDGNNSLGDPLAQHIAFIHTEHNHSHHRPSRPNVEIMFCRINPHIVYPPADPNRAIEVNEISTPILLLHPRSRGNVTLASKNPLDHPKIDPRYLESPYDMQTLVNALKFYKRLTETEAFRSVNATFVDLVPEQCRSKIGDEQLICLIMYKTAPMHHQIGTCRLGHSPKTSCVNDELQLHGVRNLRVIDSSVIPRSTSGHTVPVVIMMAEAISDVIIAYHRHH